MPTQRQIFEALLSDWEPRIRDAFLASIAKVRNDVTLRVVIERLERGDMQGVIDALAIEREAFGEFENAIAQTFNAGGTAQADALRLRDPSGDRVMFRFGVRNPQAEEWLRWHSSTLITRITDDMREAVRQHLATGMEQGRNPRQTALDLVGRVSRASNSRQGGVLGLTAVQERYVASARSELTSGDPAAMRNYLSRGRRDKRFDRTVEKAIREGRPVPAEMVDRITGRYSDGLLNLRGEVIARSETLSSLNGGRNEAMRQAIASGKVDARYVVKRWRATHDGRTRFTHALLDGKEVGFNEPFISASGAHLQYPGDPSAPGREHIGCRCTMELRVDYTAQLIERRRLERV